MKLDSIELAEVLERNNKVEISTLLDKKYKQRDRGEVTYDSLAIEYANFKAEKDFKKAQIETIRAHITVKYNFSNLIFPLLLVFLGLINLRSGMKHWEIAESRPMRKPYT